MPLLVCPNDSASMQSVQRNGVEFDFCPTCRGVWLDRGELEKLMTASREEGGYDAAPPPRDPRRDDERRYEDRRYEERRFDERPRDRHDGGGSGYRKKKRGFDIFDIFD